MPEKTKPKHDMDERVSIPLDPEEALRALLKVEPESVERKVVQPDKSSSK
jgi:hypothetical protein